MDPIKAQSLQAALKEAQDSIRSFDTKAQIVGVGYIFAIDIIQRFVRAAPNKEAVIQVEQVRFLITWILVFVPIMMFARVLYPSRGTMELSARHTFYIPSAHQMTVAQFKEEVAECDWLEEVAAEIIKVSRLRDLKRRRFLSALWAAAASYGLMFLYIMTQSLRAVSG
ncbi:MAG: hypothetical protein AAGJ73_03825 [Pseudomonadota bacterium]